MSGEFPPFVFWKYLYFFSIFCQGPWFDPDPHSVKLSLQWVFVGKIPNCLIRLPIWNSILLSRLDFREGEFSISLARNSCAYVFTACVFLQWTISIANPFLVVQSNHNTCAKRVGRHCVLSVKRLGRHFFFKRQIPKVLAIRYYAWGQPSFAQAFLQVQVRCSACNMPRPSFFAPRTPNARLHSIIQKGFHKKHPLETAEAGQEIQCRPLGSRIHRRCSARK